MLRRDVLAGGLALATTSPAWAAAEWTPDQFHGARRFVQLDIGRIAYAERGRGPAAIFLHGYPLNGFQWRGAMARLADHRRCLAVDLMGLGYSEVASDADLSPTAQAAMVVAVMDGLGLHQADFVSNDSATGVAQLIAARHPERVRSLLLTNGDVDANSPPAPFMGAIEAARKGELVAWFDKLLADNAFARSHDGIGRGYSYPERVLTPAVVETYLRPLVGPDRRRRQGQGYAVAMLPNPLPAAAPALRRFDKPVRVVWARDNELFGDEWARWLDQAFPRSRGVRFVDGANLFFPEERPELIAEEARKLWGV